MNQLNNMAQNSVQLIEAVVLHDQPALAAEGVLDRNRGTELFAQVILSAGCSGRPRSAAHPRSRAAADSYGVPGPQFRAPRDSCRPLTLQLRSAPGAAAGPAARGHAPSPARASPAARRPHRAARAAAADY